ncbi:MAG: 4-(cytidine 5-diphospho)-2-C-methyl-D-erythritol kinase [Pseudomonadota bacterium]|jgi:4-diphosphocytidyl-2-C-methyl-D-erythritol kinase
MDILQDLPSPAKLNLFLHIVGRRADGYHLLESAFVFLRFGDLITLRLRQDDHVVQTVPIAGVPAEADLCVRAARLLQTHTACRLGVDIRVQKHIPQGAGLGGGSSNAATVLLGLNRLWGLDLPRSQLIALGLQLGADVPFFIQGQNALVRGVGEEFTPLDVPCRTLELLFPQEHVPTPVIFQDALLPRNDERLSGSAWATGHGRNSMASVARRLYPQLDACLTAVPEARMSGSGATCFRWQALSALPANVAKIATIILPQHPLKPF